MLRHAIRRFLKPSFVMTRLAIAACALFAELPQVRISVATDTHIQLRRKLCAIAFVARIAFDVRVLPKQREPRVRMVKLLARAHLLPTAGGMAALARLPKRVRMRILMAVRATLECARNSKLNDFRRRRRGRSAVIPLMAGRAKNLRVPPRQAELSFAVQEIWRILPTRLRMAIPATRRKLALVHVLMARPAPPIQPGICGCQTCALQYAPVSRVKVLKVMTLVALQGRVFPLQAEPRL